MIYTDFHISFAMSVLSSLYRSSVLLNTVLATELYSYDIKKVIPQEYHLYQVADLICTLELLEAELASDGLSKSELLLFHSGRDLKKDFLKVYTRKDSIIEMITVDSKISKKKM